MARPRKYHELSPELQSRMIAEGKKILKTHPRMTDLTLFKTASDVVAPGKVKTYALTRGEYRWFWEKVRTPDVPDFTRIIQDNKTIIDLLLDIGAKQERMITILATASATPSPPTPETKKKLLRIAVIGVLPSQSGRIITATKGLAKVNCFDNVEKASNNGYGGYDRVIFSRHCSHAATNKAILDLGADRVVIMTTTNIGDIIATIQNYAEVDGA